MHLYYKVHDLFEVLVLILNKARKEGYTISVCFENKEECDAISAKLWNAYEPIPHGIVEDGFLQEQKIILDNVLYEKDIAIIVGNAWFEEKNFKKVFFINSAMQTNGKCYEYVNKKWNEITKEQYSS